MKALILNGLGKDDDAGDGIHALACAQLESEGWKTESFVLRDTKVAACLGCFGCWVKTPGICVIDDAGRAITERFIGSDLVILLTPVVFGGYSSTLKKALDRIIPLISPFFMKIDGEIHHQSRYERYPRFVGIGVLEAPDVESERIFTALVRRNAVNSHSPACAAGVVVKKQGREEIGATIHELLIKAEVMQ